MTCRLLNVRYARARQAWPTSAASTCWLRSAEVGVGAPRRTAALPARRWTRPTSSSSCCCRARSRAACSSACARPRATSLASTRRRRAHPSRSASSAASGPSSSSSTSHELLAGDLRRRSSTGSRRASARSPRPIASQYFRNAARVDLHSIESHGPSARRGLSDAARHPLPHTFDYDEPRPRVAERAAGRARSSDEHQQLISLPGHHARRRPGCFSFTDYWGTRVDAFGVREPHVSLEVIAEADGRDAAARRCSPCRRTSTSLRDDAVPRRAPRVPQPSDATRDWGGGVADEAEPRARGSRAPDLVSIVLALHRVVRTLAAATRPARPTSASRSRRCSPRRRASARTTPTSRSRCAAASASPPATCRATCSPRTTRPARTPTPRRCGCRPTPGSRPPSRDGGWLALDPTNAPEVGLRHVKIGHGRDYDDVPPLRGVFSGAAAPSLGVTVEIRRLAGRRAPQTPAPQ